MSLNVTGKCQVYKFVNRGKFATLTLRTAKKDKDGNWEADFTNALLVGKNLVDFIDDKTYINITSSVLNTSKGYTNKEGKEIPGSKQITIFEFELSEAPVASYEPKPATTAGQFDAFDPDDTEALPF